MSTNDFDLLPPDEAIKQEAGVEVSKLTATRWSTHGRCGVLLKRKRVGGRWYSCRAWAREYLAEVEKRAEERARRA